MYEYSAPEVASGGPQGDSADIFPLGFVFWKCSLLLQELLPWKELVHAATLLATTLIKPIMIKAMLGREPELRPQAADVWRLAMSLTTDAGGLFNIWKVLPRKPCSLMVLWVS